MMKPNQLSFVIQGPVYASTPKAIESVRTCFPGCEIILSTWKGSDTQGLRPDHVVENDDPGGCRMVEGADVFNATNRQIVSSSAGLRLASRPYAVKMRSDMYFVHPGFLKYIDRFPKRNSDLAFSRQRFLLSTLVTPYPRRYPLLFHPSDWFYCSLREDMIDLFDIPLAPEPETSEWFKTRPELRKPNEPWLTRYRPEQYIWLSYLRKYIDIPFEHAYDDSDAKIELAERIFANNAVLLDPEQLGYRSSKHLNWLRHRNIGAYSPFYQYIDWLRHYQKYCDPGFRIHDLDMNRWFTTAAWAMAKFRKDNNVSEAAYVTADLLGLLKIRSTYRKMRQLFE